MRKTKKEGKFQSDYSIYVLQHNFFFSSYAAIILLTCMKNYVYFSWHEFFLLSPSLSLSLSLLISCDAICLALTPSHSLCVSFLSLLSPPYGWLIMHARDKKWEKQAPVMENSVGKRMRSGCIFLLPPIYIHYPAHFLFCVAAAFFSF